MPIKKSSRTSAKGAVSKVLTPDTGGPSSHLSNPQRDEVATIINALQDGSNNVESLLLEQQRLLEGIMATRSLGGGSQSSPKKRNSEAVVSSGSKRKTQTSTSPKKTPKKEPEEKRQRRFRPRPPASFDVKLHRVRTQRMIVVGRQHSTTESGAPAEDIDVVGSTGNIYTVHVGHVTSCTCPDSLKGNECKHKVYALHTVLKAPEDLVYQLAFLSSELKQIFAHAPPIPTDVVEDEDNDSKGNRKPTDGECPICYMDLDAEHNKLVWCKAQCGHNLHKSCFEQWVASQRGQEVRCVYCRTPWQAENGDLDAVRQSGEMGEDGYINVADHFGMSRARDYSGYHQPWVRRQFGSTW